MLLVCLLVELLGWIVVVGWWEFGLEVLWVQVLARELV